MAKIKLKSCPFCGGEAVFQHGATVGFTTFKDLISVYCDACGRSEGFVYKNKTAAAKSWNTRVEQ